MPVEGIVRIPTMSGVTLVHNITSLMLSKTRTVVKASTTPSLWSLSALLFRSVNKADVTVSVDSKYVNISRKVFLEEYSSEEEPVDFVYVLQSFPELIEINLGI